MRKGVRGRELDQVLRQLQAREFPEGEAVEVLELVLNCLLYSAPHVLGYRLVGQVGDYRLQSGPMGFLMDGGV